MGGGKSSLFSSSHLQGRRSAITNTEDERQSLAHLHVLLPTPASRKKLFPCVRQSAPGHSTPFLSDLPLACVFICPFAPPPPPPLPSCLLQQKRRKCASPPLLRPCHVPPFSPVPKLFFHFLSSPLSPFFFAEGEARSGKRGPLPFAPFSERRKEDGCGREEMRDRPIRIGHFSLFGHSYHHALHIQRKGLESSCTVIRKTSFLQARVAAARINHFS